MANTPSVARTWIVTVAAILAALLGFGFALWLFRGAEKVGELLPATLGPFFTILGTLAGAVAGHAAGAAGTQAAQEQATEAQKQAGDAQTEAIQAQQRYTAVAEVADKNILDAAKRRYPDLF